MAANRKLVCEHCGWTGDVGERLTARHPFRSGAIEDGMIEACPECQVLESTLVVACQADGCDRPATCCTKDGRQLCASHFAMSLF